MCSLPAKVTELQDTTLRVKEEILRFDVPVAHAISVDVRQRTEQLIHVELGEGEGEERGRNCT